jgi:hypothetical protein
MERERFQGYVASLEHIIKNVHLDLREVMEQFQELCHRVTSEKIIPMGLITDIRQTYKEIQDQLKKIQGVHQLLEGKYRLYYHRDAQRDKEIFEFAFLAKSLYSKFEYTLMEIEAKKNLKSKGERFEAGPQRIPVSWFHSEENQIILLRNLETLYDLDYITLPDGEGSQRREVIRNGLRSVSLFVVSGEDTSIDTLQSHMRLREYDIKERLARDELRGALTHLREISLSEVERVIRRFTDHSEFLKLKCLLLSIRSQRDLKKEILSTSKNILQWMKEGEVRTLSIRPPSIQSFSEAEGRSSDTETPSRCQT